MIDLFERVTKLTGEEDGVDVMYLGFSEAFETVFKESVFTSIANLIGIPALVSGGVQLMGKQFDENVLLSIAGCVEKEGE